MTGIRMHSHLLAGLYFQDTWDINRKGKIGKRFKGG